MSAFDEGRVVPDGGAVRRLRRSRGWSRRTLVHAIAEAHERASGLRRGLTLNQLEGIEEANEPVEYETLCRVAAGLDCDPMELLLDADAGLAG